MTKQSFNWRRPLRSWRDRRQQWWEAAAEYPAEEGFDPLGSYTGQSDAEDAVPEQDADDL
ncbi:MAG: hypothetical protein LBS96_09195 [Oscillospiraceae bacterium]|jgi:hypothetical protein|nr:hypothetical protein [Oscillospiraceae bacterium]